MGTPGNATTKVGSGDDGYHECPRLMLQLTMMEPQGSLVGSPRTIKGVHSEYLKTLHIEV